MTPPSTPIWCAAPPAAESPESATGAGTSAQPSKASWHNATHQQADPAHKENNILFPSALKFERTVTGN